MALFSRFIRERAKDAAAGSPDRMNEARKYAAVEVVPSEDACCKAVQSLVGKRFLSEEAPLFPLRECDQPKCDCKYRRYPDRRLDIRRAADLGFTVLSRMLFRDANRRDSKAPGRRSTDR